MSEFWQGVLAALLGSMFTIAGQALIHFLSQRSHRANELWRRQVETIERLETKFAQGIHYLRTVNVMTSETSRDRAQRFLQEFPDDFGDYEGLFVRHPGLGRRATKLLVAMQQYNSLRLNNPELTEQMQALDDDIKVLYWLFVHESDKAKVEAGHRALPRLIWRQRRERLKELATRSISRIRARVVERFLGEDDP